MTANVQKGAEEGNVVSMRHKAYAPVRTRERSSHALRGRVLRSVLRPVRVNPHYTPAAKVEGGGAVESVSRLGKAWVTKKEPTLGSARTDEARLAASHRCRKTSSVRCSRKGRRSRSPSLRGSRVVRFSCPHVEVQLQKSVGDNWSRISSANALQKEWQG